MWEGFLRLLGPVGRLLFYTLGDLRHHLRSLERMFEASPSVELTNTVWSLGIRYRYRTSSLQPVKGNEQLILAVPTISDLPPPAHIAAKPRPMRYVVRSPAVCVILLTPPTDSRSNCFHRYENGATLARLSLLGTVVDFTPECLWRDLGSPQYDEITEYEAYYVLRVLVDDNQSVEWGQEIFEVALARRWPPRARST